MTAVTAVLALLAFAQQPSLGLADRRLVPGSSVQITGQQLPPGPVLLMLAGDRDTHGLGSVTIPGSGALLSHEVRIPSGVTAGAYRLLAVAGNRSAAALDVAVLEAASPTGVSQPASRQAPAGTDATEAAPEGDVPSSHQDNGKIQGYDWPRLHAALNDVPAALLVFALLFEIAALVSRSESLRAAGFWSLLGGVAGMAAAAGAGLMAENRVAHDDLAHEVMTRHKTTAIVSFALFAILTAWRVMRRKADSRTERFLWSGFAGIGVALLIVVSNLGGSLVFDHALGVSSPTLRTVLERRGDMPVMAADTGDADTTTRTTPAGHRDRPGAAPHSH